MPRIASDTDRLLTDQLAAERAARRELEVLLQLSARTSQARTAAEACVPALDAVGSLLGVERASIRLADGDGLMQLGAWRGMSEATANDPVGGRALVSLLDGEALLGELVIHDPPRRFDAHQQQLADAIAAPLTQALVRARLFELERDARASAERQADRTRRLQRFTARISQVLIACNVAAVVLDEGIGALGASGGELWQRDDHDGLDLLRVSGDGRPEPDAQVLRAFRDGEAVWLSSLAALPLRFHGEVIGVLAFRFDAARWIDVEERVFLELLAQHCAHALDRARLYEAERTARHDAEAAGARAGFLAEASALLSRSLDTATTLRSVAALAVPRIADWCTVDLDQVTRTGRSELYEEVSDPVPVAGARSMMIVPIRGHGRTLGVITFVYRDDRRYRPADLLMAEQLAERAGLAIGNAQLYQQAEQAVSVRDDFLSIAGHELKTPLTAMMLQIQTMERCGATEPPDKQADRSRKLLRIAGRLVTLVDELLEVSRISSGRLELEVEAVDLGEVVTEHVERLTDELRRAGAHLQLVVAGGLVGRWDRSRIEQVVTNLLSNAVKYGKGHPIEVGVAGSDGRAVLTVRDHGIGIAPADQVRIFGRFERAVSSRHFGGLGLGLWIARQIIEAHGGTIAVASTPGEGAEFRVELPLATR